MEDVTPHSERRVDLSKRNGSTGDGKHFECNTSLGVRARVAQLTAKPAYTSHVCEEACLDAEVSVRHACMHACTCAHAYMHHGIACGSRKALWSLGLTLLHRLRVICTSET